MPYRIPKPASQKASIPQGPKLFQAKKELPPWQMPPLGWPVAGSVAEWAIYWALTVGLGMKDKEDFYYQYGISFAGQILQGGGHSFGQTSADFYVPAQRLVMRVQGLYFHYGLGIDVRVQDAILKNEMEQAGYAVVDLDEDQCLDRPIWLVKEALEGRDHSRAATGSA